MTIVLPSSNATAGARAQASGFGAVAFGPLAELYARSFAADFPLIACDGNRAAEALAEATRRRRAGARFFVAPLLIDSDALVARERAHEFWAQFPTEDERRLVFEGLAQRSLSYNNQPFFSAEAYRQPVLGTMRELAQMGDALLFRSHGERNAFCRRLNISPSYVGIAPGNAELPEIPTAAPQAAKVLVWAPYEQAERLAIYAYALWEMQLSARFVCEGRLENSPHEFFAPAAAAAALSEAAVVIDADLSSPAGAIAFAERGYGLAAARTSGAHEYVQGLQTYEPTDFYSIMSAAARARGSRRPIITAGGASEADLRNLLAATAPQLPAELPLLSVVIPTYNRPRELRQCLEAMAKQDYPNFEVIVVNDAGCAVDDIVAEFPFARYAEHTVNANVVETINTGMRLCKGDYVGIVADDDCKYPHHLSTLVEALAASNLPIAHSDVILRLNTTMPDGTSATYGHLLFYENANDRLAVLWGGSASHLLGYLIKRELFEELGYMDPTAGNAADCDAILKLSARTDFAHVRAVHGEQSYRDDRTNGSAAIGDALPRIIADVYGRYGRPERSLVVARQQANVDATAAAQQRRSFFQPRLTLERPIPL